MPQMGVSCRRSLQTPLPARPGVLELGRPTGQTYSRLGASWKGSACQSCSGVRFQTNSYLIPVHTRAFRTRSCRTAGCCRFCTLNPWTLPPMERTAPATRATAGKTGDAGAGSRSGSRMKRIRRRVLGAVRAARHG